MKRKKLYAFAALIASVAVLSACGSNTSSPSESSSSAGTSTTSSEDDTSSLSGESSLVDSSSEDSSSEGSSLDEGFSEDSSSEDSSSDDSSSEDNSSEDSSTGSSTVEEIEAYLISVSIDDSIGSFEITGAQTETGLYEPGTEIEISVSVIDTAYTLSSITSNDARLTTDIESGYASFSMPANDVSITVEFELIPVKTYAVTINCDSNIGSYSVSGLDENGEAEAGTEITVSVSVTDENYYIASISSEQVTFTRESIDSAAGMVTFTMLEQDVTINVAFELVPLKNYSVTVNCDSTIATYSVTGLDEDGEAEAGTEIKVSVTLIDSSYTISSVTSENVTFTSENISADAATVLFSMPEQDVVVNVAFEIVPSDGYRLSTVKVFKEDYFVDLTLKEGTVYEAGTTVSFTFSSDSKVENYHFVNVNGKSFHPTLVDDSASPYKYEGNFTMPEEDVTLYFVYCNNGTAEDNENGNYSVTVKSYDGTKMTIGSNEYITFINPAVGSKYVSGTYYPVIVRSPSVSLTNIAWSVSGGTSGSITKFTNQSDTSTACKRSGSAISKADFVGNLTITVNYEIVGASKLNIINDEHVDYTSSSTFDSEMPVGESVNIYYYGIDDKYISDSAIVEGVTPTNNKQSGTSINYYIQFTMPDNDVTITYVLADCVKFNYVQNEHLSRQLAVGGGSGTAVSYIISNPTSSGIPGRSYYVGGVVEEGYKFESITIDGAETAVSYQSSNDLYYCKFTCADTDMTFSANVTNAFIASTDISSSCATVKFGTSTSSATYEAGDEVTFTITPTSAYVLDTSSVSLVDEENNAVEFTLDSSSTYSLATGTFTMPSSNVTLSAAFAALYQVSLTVSDDNSAVSDVLVTGQLSGSILSTSGSSAYFVDGETAVINVTYNSAYSLTVYTVDSEGAQTAVEPVLNSEGVYYATLTISGSVSSILVSVSTAV